MAREWHVETRPDGLVVESTVPFIEPRWWDNPWLHPVWSYASWVSMIARSYGHEAPRRWFDRWWQR